MFDTEYKDTKIERINLELSEEDGFVDASLVEGTISIKLSIRECGSEARMEELEREAKRLAHPYPTRLKLKEAS